jgi:hypothetical protein
MAWMKIPCNAAFTVMTRYIPTTYRGKVLKQVAQTRCLALCCRLHESADRDYTTGQLRSW